MGKGYYKELKTQLKDMPMNKKIEHIWEYYKIPIISIICLIFILTYSIVQYQNTKTSILTVALFGSGIDTKNISSEEVSIKQAIFKESGNREKVTLQPMNAGDDIQMQNSLLQKFVSQVSIGAIDVVIITEKDFQKDAKVGMFKRLDDKIISELNLTDKEILRFQRIQDEKKYAYAINIDSNTKFKIIGFDSKNKCIAIISTSKNYNNAEKFIKWFIKQ